MSCNTFCLQYTMINWANFLGYAAKKWQPLLWVQWAEESFAQLYKKGGYNSVSPLPSALPFFLSLNIYQPTEKGTSLKMSLWAGLCLLWLETHNLSFALHLESTVMLGSPLSMCNSKCCLSMYSDPSAALHPSLCGRTLKVIFFNLFFLGCICAHGCFVYI